MRINKNIVAPGEDLKLYRAQINGDSLFLKVQLVFGVIFFFVILVYIISNL